METSNIGPLYHKGKDFLERLRLPHESEIAYTDGCREIMIKWENNVKFTSKAILSYDRMYLPIRQRDDDWIETTLVEFCPWHNIEAIYKIKQDKLLNTYNSDFLKKCLLEIQDPEMRYPFLRVSPWQIVYIDVGKPKSSRSKGGKRRFREDVMVHLDKIQRIFPNPPRGKIEMKIDVFFESNENHADVDRFSTHILDAFNGIAYKDDKQVKDLRPRVLDVSRAYDVLECRTEPMGLFSVDNIPTAVLFPLATGVTSYYAVTINLI
jgi:hypothetical protein